MSKRGINIIISEGEHKCVAGLTYECKYLNICGRLNKGSQVSSLSNPQNLWIYLYGEKDFAGVLNYVCTGVCPWSNLSHVVQINFSVQDFGIGIQYTRKFKT